MPEYRDERDFDVIFIHSALDDADLSVYAFRLYARIARRASPRGQCYESQPNMAQSCNMTRKRLKKALDELTERNMVRVTKRPGETSVITLTRQDEWADSGKGTPGENTRATPGDTTRTTPGENDQGPRADSPAPPRVKSPDKGNPYEGNPPKARAREGNPVQHTPDENISVDDHPAVKLHQKFWPGLADWYQREQIAAKVDDLDRWRSALEYWKGNGHRGKSVMKQIRMYRRGDYKRSYGGDGRASDPPARPNASAYTNTF